MKVFISYKSQNRDFANHLRDTLHSWGHETWMDVHAIPPGAVWTDEIQKGLEWADVTVGVMTEIALRSENVKNEWNWTIAYRQKYGKQLMLLRLEDCDVPMHYINLNWIDIANIGQTAGLDLLQRWLLNPDKIPTSIPVTTPEPYQDYLETLYDELVDELNFLVLSVERMISIPGHSTPEQIDEPRRMLRSFSIRRLHENNEMTLVNFEEGLEKAKRRLLLLGDAGAGKTITLLTTARDAVLNRMQDSSAPLPLVGRIATWDANQQVPLYKWFAEYTQLSENTIREELQRGSCYLLLDGLDELGSTRVVTEGSQTYQYDPRKSFIDQINELPKNTQLLITCRTTDYTEIGTKLRLNSAVTLQNLSNEQIRDYLGATKATSQLWDTLQNQPDLLDVARIPLLLSLFAFSFRDLPEETRNLKDLSQGKLRDAIFGQYVNRRYEHEQIRYRLRDEQPPFTLEQVYSVLGRIALHGANKYGTGEVTFLPTVDATWGYWIVIKDLEFGFLGDEKISSDKFIQFAKQIHLLVQIPDTEMYRFTHHLMRDFFVFKFCTPITPKIDSYAIAALAKINDSRVPDLLLEISKADLPENTRLYALKVYNIITGSMSDNIN